MNQNNKKSVKFIEMTKYEHPRVKRLVHSPLCKCFFAKIRSLHVSYKSIWRVQSSHVTGYEPILDCLPIIWLRLWFMHESKGISLLRVTFDLIWYTELHWLQRNTTVGILQTKTLLLYLMIRRKLLHSDQHLRNRQVPLCPLFPLLKMHRS